MPTSRLRHGTREDLEAVLELWARADATATVTDSVEALGLLLDADPEALLLAEVDGRVVGSVIAAWNGWRGSFYRLAVDPRHRRRGLGTRLVSFGEQRLRARGAARIDALAATDEPVARRFWETCGYGSQPERTRYVRNF
ncbi:MAG TPA: GNAT family N-acetyltransferase [Solirubrobacteraceae bacterium]